MNLIPTDKPDYKTQFQHAGFSRQTTRMLNKCWERTITKKKKNNKQLIQSILSWFEKETI